MVIIELLGIIKNTPSIKSIELASATTRRGLISHECYTRILSERAQQKRARDFDLIYKLHYKEKIGLNYIYRKYGYSPTYIKSVLSDKGMKTIKGKVNQYKLE